MRLLNNSHKIETSFSPGRSRLHTIFNNVSDPNGHAKRNIMMGKLELHFIILINMHHYINKYIIQIICI